MSKPLIIWTFRRTGGTNLARHLFEHSDYDTVKHEPFNPDRVYGDVFKEWIDRKDEEVLYKRLSEILKNKVNIKHCLEITPPRFNEILLNVAIEQGYNHLFLYREKAANRLLSLNYAQVTGIWGKEQKGLNQEIDYSIPVNVEKLIKHEKQCRQSMRAIFSKCIEKQVYPISVSFEMLYQNEYKISNQYVHDIVRGCGIKEDTLTEDVLQNLLKRGAQGTKHEYLKFPRAQELISEAEELSNLTFNTVSKTPIKYEVNEEKIQHFEIWSSLPSVFYGYYHLYGVCLPDESIKEDYTFINSISLEELNFIKLPSDRIRKLYPNNSYSADARFLTEAISSLDIHIQAGDMKLASLNS